MPARSPIGVVPSRAQASGVRMSWWGLAGWSGGAILAVAAVVAALRTEVGIERARADFAAVTNPKASQDLRGQNIRDQESRAPTSPPASDKLAAWSGGVDQQLRHQAEVIRSLAEQRDGLADKVGAMERQLNEVGGLLSRATARLESEAKSAREAAAAASTSAAAAAAAARLAQARQEQVKREAADAGVTGSVAIPAAAGIRANPAATAAGTMPATVPAREAAAGRLGQIPGMSAAGGEFFATAAAAAPAPAYTGTIPMPVAGSAASAAPSLVRPFPADAAAQAATMAAAQTSVPETAAPSPAAPKPQSRPPVPVSALSHAPPFQSNPLMTAGIFDEPAELGAIGTEFAVDLGGAASVETLRARWNTLRANESPLFDNLKPLVALKEGGRSGQELHLIAGPLTSAAATARVCAIMSGSGVSCRPSTFEGQHLATR
jgi:hypothetical protein